MIANLVGMALSYCKTLISTIKDYKTALGKTKTNQNEYKSDLNKIRRTEKKINGQKYTIYNIEMLYKTGKSVTKLFHNYFLMVVIDKYQTGRSGGIKVLTPTKMF